MSFGRRTEKFCDSTNSTLKQLQLSVRRPDLFTWPKWQCATYNQANQLTKPATPTTNATAMDWDARAPAPLVPEAVSEVAAPEDEELAVADPAAEDAAEDEVDSACADVSFALPWTLVDTTVTPVEFWQLAV